MLFDVLILYFCVGVGDVGGEISGGEGFTGGVLPYAAEVIDCSDEFECGAGGEAGECGTVGEHAIHARHVLCIQRR